MNTNVVVDICLRLEYVSLVFSCSTVDKIEKNISLFDENKYRSFPSKMSLCIDCETFNKMCFMHLPLKHPQGNLILNEAVQLQSHGGACKFSSNSVDRFGSSRQHS